MVYVIRFFNETFRVYLAFSTYKNGNLAVQLLDTSSRETLWTLSLDQPDAQLEPGEFIFKTYRENDGLLDQLIAQGAVRLTDRTIQVCCAGSLPVCRLAI